VSKCGEVLVCDFNKKQTQMFWEFFIWIMAVSMVSTWF